MTEAQIERLVELLFNKMVKRQEEWDREHFLVLGDAAAFNIPESENTTAKILYKIEKLEKLFIKAIEEEHYLHAKTIRDEINLLNDKLNE